MVVVVMLMLVLINPPPSGALGPTYPVSISLSISLPDPSCPRV